MSRSSQIRVAVIGAGSWGTTVAAIASVNTPDDALGARGPSSPSRSTAPTSTPTTCATSRCRATCGPRRRSRRRSATPTSWSWRCRRTASARSPPRRRRSCGRGCRRQPVQGDRARHADADDRGRGRGDARPPGRRDDRAEPGTEILAGQPAASVVAIHDATIASELQRILTQPTLRVYTNPDVVGCEVAGVVKNVIAIAAGHGRGHGLRRQHAGDADHPRVWRR